MQIIFFTKAGKRWQMQFSRTKWVFLSFGVLLFTLITFEIFTNIIPISYMAKFNLNLNDATKLAQFVHITQETSAQYTQLRQNYRSQMDEILAVVANLENKLSLLEASNQKLLTKFDLNLQDIAANTGVNYDAHHTITSDKLETILFELGKQISEQEQLANIITNSVIATDALNKTNVDGSKPTNLSWISSHFGARIDPMTGRHAFHHGIDMAGQLGQEIAAVASGLVTRSEQGSGYGYLVEIDHGNGLKTRYAHNSKNLVKIGDIVTKGQVVAKMGSTGKSTGYHVHFEVLKDNQAIDPLPYLR